MRIKNVALFLLIIFCISLTGCKADMEGGSQQAVATASEVIITPEPEPTEPPILASNLLENMKQYLDSVESYSIDEYFELELSGDMNDAFAQSSSELEFERTSSGFKVLGNERTDRDAGSNDKVTKYKLYAETTEEGMLTLQTRADGTWAKELLEDKASLDHISKYYTIIDHADNANYIGFETVDGVVANVIEYTLTPSQVRQCIDRLEKFSVPAQALGEDKISQLCSTIEMKAILYLRQDGENMVPIKLVMDYAPLQRAMLEGLDVEIDVVKAYGRSIIGSFDEVEPIAVPTSAQSVYGQE